MHSTIATQRTLLCNADAGVDAKAEQSGPGCFNSNMGRCNIEEVSDRLYKRSNVTRLRHQRGPHDDIGPREFALLRGRWRGAEGS